MSEDKAPYRTIKHDGKWYTEAEFDDYQKNKNGKLFGNKITRHRYVAISLIILILLLAGFIYLKQYRIAYCQARYGQEKQTLFSDLIPNCFDRPLYKFIWK